jgi:hypothetical protein
MGEECEGNGSYFIVTRREEKGRDRK